MPRIGIHVAFLAMVALVGCSRSDDNLPKLAPVSGTVTVDGKPLPKATVSFIPVGDTRGDGGSGKTDANGRYQLAYVRGRPGTAPGEYQVVISKRLMPDGKEVPDDDKTPPMESPARESLSPKYSDRQQSILKATVPEQGGTVDFPLKSRP